MSEGDGVYSRFAKNLARTERMCPVTLTLSGVDTMPRTAGGKYERIVSAAAA